MLWGLRCCFGPPVSALPTSCVARVCLARPGLHGLLSPVCLSPVFLSAVFLSSSPPVLSLSLSPCFRHRSVGLQPCLSAICSSSRLPVSSPSVSRLSALGLSVPGVSISLSCPSSVFSSLRGLPVSGLVCLLWSVSGLLGYSLSLGLVSVRPPVCLPVCCLSPVCPSPVCLSPVCPSLCFVCPLPFLCVVGAGPLLEVTGTDPS